MFSVIMPVYLGDYAKGANLPSAKDKPEKFRRAINSVLAQTFMAWELVIVSDGCDQAVEIYVKEFSGSERIKCYRIEKTPLWSPEVRNAGLRKASNPWIVYLDADDQWGVNHLLLLKRAIEEKKPELWGYFNDHAWSPSAKVFKERIVDVDRAYHYGTANVVHRNVPGLLWPHQFDRNGSVIYNYGKQDKVFVDELKRRSAGVKLPTPEYLCCHDPGRFDV